MLNKFGQALITALTATIVGTASANAADTLVYASYAPPTASWNKYGILPWLDKINELGQGLITTQFIGGGSAVKASTGVYALRDGTVDGTLLGANFPTELPIVTMLGNLGPLLTNPAAAAAAITETELFDCPSCKDEMERWNIRFLTGWATPSYQLLCSQPVKTLADLQGKRIRAIGFFTRASDSMGAVPVSMTVSEVYEALQRGQADCSFGTFGWLESFSIGEVATQIVQTNAGVFVGGPLIDVRLDLWREFSAEQQQLVYDTLAFGLSSAIFGYASEDEKALAAGGDRYTVIEPAEDLAAALNKAKEAEKAQAIADAKTRGVENPEVIVEVFLENYREWEQWLAETDGSREAYEALLNEKIFSRLTPES